ncbi:protein shifted isoform X3 [Ixodes scapularis]|uniref:protein shifted isoform X3 n=1 Tax=Ixodes scapularis TaxID=6945 RepID=UPI001161AD82|nr:protein shifted isoform X3 [Ixodes scapularis]
MPAAEASARRPTTTTASSSGSSCSMSRLPEVLTALVLALLGLTPALPAKSRNDDFSLWIDEKQVREFSGFPMEIFAILDGVVLPYILDPNFEKYLPVIPSEVNSVNFTWKAGENKNYYYDFDVLESFDSSVLANPLLSVASKGKVPRKPKVFQVFLPCLGNVSGTASFGIGLRIQNDKGRFLSGTPLRLRLQKQCADNSPDPECDRKCANGGRCNAEKICECPKRYMGRYCRTALCYPQCMNGGTCVSPGICDCAVGYQGPHCEGGICAEKCLNGGKCVQKDTCSCRRGYYGPRCEYSKCSIPCLNGGRCVGVNQCRCTRSFVGPQCAHRIDSSAAATVHKDHCQRRCVHGVCVRSNRCLCDEGFYGRRHT